MFELLGMAGNALKASIKYVGEGMPNVSTDEYNRRLLICSQCDNFKNDRCLLCGCFVRLKARMSTERCPENKWSENISTSTQTVTESGCGCQGISNNI